jgi:hypothetical protein
MQGCSADRDGRPVFKFWSRNPQANNSVSTLSAIEARYSSTSSAVANNLSGTVMPSAWALRRFITNSILSTFSTASSAGAAPDRLPARDERDPMRVLNALQFMRANAHRVILRTLGEPRTPCWIYIGVDAPPTASTCQSGVFEHHLKASVSEVITIGLDNR